MRRRRFIRQMALGLTGISGVGLYTWKIEPHWVEFTQSWLLVKDLPRRLNGAKLVQLSDLHVGPQVDSKYIIRTLKRVSELNPDLVVMTGDFISYDGDWVLGELERVMQSAPRAKHGSFACLGNHDYGKNWSDLGVAGKVKMVLTDAGIEVLNNRIGISSGLQIVGLDDLWGPNFDPAPVFSSVKRDAPRICLCHNPDALDREGWGDYEGWVLAGHTHGGQCKPPFLKPPILPVRNRLYTAGEIKVGGSRQLYINRGLGHLLKVRFNVRPEVTVFTLQSA